MDWSGFLLLRKLPLAILCRYQIIPITAAPMRKKKPARSSVEYNVTINLQSGRQRLAMRAVMGTALPNHNACNWRATFGTGFPGALINPEIVLEISTAIDPIDTGAITGNPVLQDGTDALQQYAGLLFGKAIAGNERV